MGRVSGTPARYCKCLYRILFPVYTDHVILLASQRASVWAIERLDYYLPIIVANGAAHRLAEQ